MCFFFIDLIVFLYLIIIIIIIIIIIMVVLGSFWVSLEKKSNAEPLLVVLSVFNLFVN